MTTTDDRIEVSWTLTPEDVDRSGTISLDRLAWDRMTTDERTEAIRERVGTALVGVLDVDWQPNNASLDDPTCEPPTWAEMSELDKGAALMHLHKRENEGSDYAEEHYPVRYFDNRILLSMDDEEACEHAASLADDAEGLDGDEFERLYELARNHERA